MSTRQIFIDLRQPSVTGADVPASGSLTWEPTRIRTTDVAVILPEKFVVQLNAGVATVMVEVPDGTWAWRVTEQMSKGRRNRLLHIPAGDPDEPVTYSKLVELDPASLTPTATPDPAWLVLVMDLSRRLDALAAGAGVDPAELKALATQAVAEAIAETPPAAVTAGQVAAAIDEAMGGGGTVLIGEGPPPEVIPGARVGQLYLDQTNRTIYKLGA